MRHPYIYNNVVAMLRTLVLFLVLGQLTDAQGRNAESETMTIMHNGQRVDIRITYPFTKQIDGVALWINDGARDSFIADRALRYYDVRATLRGSLFKAHFASAEYISPRNADAAEVAVEVMDRLRKESKLKDLKFSLIAFGDECMVAPKVCRVASEQVAKVLLVSPLMDNSVSSLSKNRIYSVVTRQNIRYTADTADEAAVDSMNRASSLDEEYSDDVLSRLMFMRQHQEPIDSVAAKCESREAALAEAKAYLVGRWDREDNATHRFWHNSSDSYCAYFLRHLTDRRIEFLQTDTRRLYAEIACPVMYIYGNNDPSLDVDVNMKMMNEALAASKSEKKGVVLDGYDHDLRQTHGMAAGAVDSDVVVAIVSWLTDRKIVLKESRSKKAYERLKSFGLSLMGSE